MALSAKNLVPPPSTSGLKIQKTVSFESTTHVDFTARNVQTGAFPAQNGTTTVVGGLPFISQPPSGQAMEGVGGLPVEGELFPPMRAQTAPARVHHKKQMSDKAFNGGKIVISKPIVEADAETNKFDNIPTIDLATAAMKEKERRELRPTNPFSGGDAGFINALPPRELMGKMEASKRKQVPQSAAPNNSRNLLSVDEPAIATTSALQLSPGIEETRRRSPRQPRQGDQPSPSPPPVPLKDEARTPKSAPLQAAATVLVPPPRSTKRPPPIKALQAKSPKESSAMPGVAVSRFSVSTMDPMTARIASSMFSPQDQKSAKAAPPPPSVPVNQFWVDPRTASLPRSNSVKNSIRPSRQRPLSPLVAEEEEKEAKTPLQRRATVGLPNNPRARATRMFAGEQGTAHEQQIMFMNSEEAIVHVVAAPEAEEESESPSRKSMIHRPRPIPRKSTASASALLGLSFSPSQDEFTLISTPNLPLISPVSVKSLAQSTYGATSPGSLSRHKTVRRTSFVPDLPTVPVEYQGQQPKITQEAAIEAATTNVWTVVPNDQGVQMPSSDKQAQRALCVSKFSVDTMLTTEDPRSPYNSRLSVNTQSSCEETIGRNSSVIFSSEFKPTAVSTLVNSLSDRPMRHESVDSELSLMLRMAPVPPKTAPGEKRILTQAGSKATEAPLARNVSMPESPESMESGGQLTVQQLPSWHHRVGEELPSFSSQLKYRRSRKLLVPKPLALYRPANVTVVIEAEPSPIEPTQEALDNIYEQLKQFDLENGDARATISEQQRMTILANLESEMGAQESQWQMLRVDLAPGSPSTIVSSSDINSLRNSVDISKFEIVPITKVNANAGDMLAASNEDANHRLSTSSDQLSKEEMINRRSGRMSLLSVTNRTISQIGSPTPPDTDESGEDSDNDSMVEGLGSAKDLSTVLMPRNQVPTVTSFMALDEVLNSSSEDVQSKLNVPVEFEDVSLITPKVQSPPNDAQPEEPKPVETEAFEVDSIRFSLEDLGELGELELPPPRPKSVTRRPPRQSKRISNLPDIVENPEPLAGKTGTLGIFQFPWGEKSDSARIPPRMAGIAGTMSSGRAWMSPPAAPMNSIQERQTDYSPATPQTFLDDDQFDNGLENYEDEDYDDGFDEATLWEIASLLESDLENSRDTLFMTEESWDDRMPVEVPSGVFQVEDDDSESVKEEAYDYIPVTLASSEIPSDVALQVPTLWTDNMKGSQTAVFLGLPQPSEEAWKGYSAAAPRSGRAIPRVMKELPQLSSTALWTGASTGASMYTTGLWCAPVDEKETKTAKVALKAASLVWLPPTLAKISSLGLPQPDMRLWSAYIPQATRTVRRTVRKPQPAVITTTSLWTFKSAVKPSVSNGVWRPTSKDTSEEASLAAAPSLWSQRPATRTNTWRLPQPDAQAWNAYISPENRAARRTPRGQQQQQQPLAIHSVSTWTAEPSRTIEVFSTKLWSLKTTTLLWAPRVSKDAGVGLAQPDVEVWSTYIVLSTRSIRRKAGVLKADAITSTSLWRPLPAAAPWSGGVWKAKSFPKSDSSLMVSNLLWSPSSTKTRSVGLPQPDALAWNAYLLPASRNYRKAHVPKSSIITSTSLWTPAMRAESPSGGIWKAKSAARDLLWSPSAAQTVSFGLPQPDAQLWNAYLVPTARSHQSAYVPRLVAITSTSLWMPALRTEAPSNGVWRPKTLPSATKTTTASLWTPSSAAKRSVGLPQPAASIWASYIPPMSRSTLRRLPASAPASIESRALWSPSPAMDTASGHLWSPKTKPAEKKRPVSPHARAAGVRSSLPVLMTRDEWNSAFKNVSQDANASSKIRAGTTTTRLHRSQSVKSRPFFDPSVMALISEHPPHSHGLGRSKSISSIPARLPTPTVEPLPCQPATAARD